jgi:hypothetical protein
MSMALDLFKGTLRGPFEGLAEQHAKTLIERVCSGGLITEDDPQFVGMWAALAVIWAADWHAMTASAALETEARERERRIDESLKHMLTVMRAGTIATINQLSDRLAAERGERGAQPLSVDNDAIARAVAARVTLPHIDAADIARQFAAQIQPAVEVQLHQHYDVLDSLKKAARESFSWAWAFLAAGACVGSIAYGVNAHLSSADTIAALRAENAQLQQQAAGAVAGMQHSHRQSTRGNK